MMVVVNLVLMDVLIQVQIIIVGIIILHGMGVQVILSVGVMWMMVVVNMRFMDVLILMLLITIH